MSYASSDLLSADALSPLAGSPLVLLSPGERLPPYGVKLLVDAEGRLPEVPAEAYDVLVTTRPGAPAPWVSVAAGRLEGRLAQAQNIAALSPLACHILARLLRMGERLAFGDALELESLAYSTVLGGGEFARWLSDARRGGMSSASSDAPLVRYERQKNAVTLTLASPGTRNAMTAAMRDALFEALVNVLEDPSAPTMLMQADGRCFSTGGDLAEFGSARDLAAAHVIRTQRSCAAVLQSIGERAIVHLHGACIGSGIEVPAAAARVTASPDLIVQLPELRMGLIPGAGGTVTLARRIGRHRLAWLCLGAFRINAKQARDWGMIEAVVP